MSTYENFRPAVFEHHSVKVLAAGSFKPVSGGTRRVNHLGVDFRSKVAPLRSLEQPARQVSSALSAAVGEVLNDKMVGIGAIFVRIRRDHV